MFSPAARSALRAPELPVQVGGLLYRHYRRLEWQELNL